MGYMEDLENKEYDTTNLRRVIKKLEKELEVIDKKIKESGYIEKIDLIRKQQIHEELINRYIADFLIRKLIEKYPYDFENIEISPKNFFEIAVNFEGVLSNNVDLNEFQKKLNFYVLVYIS